MKFPFKTFFMSKVLGYLGMAAILFSAVACDDDDDDNVVEPDPIAYVSLYHGSPDAPDLDIVVDDRQINTYPFDYSEYTGYLRFFTGDRTLQFSPFDANNVVIDTTLTLEDGNAYSIFVTDEYPNVDLLVLNDNADAPETGMAKIRFVHLSPDAPAVTVGTADGSGAIFEDIAFKEATEFMEVSSESYDFEVRTAEGDEVVLSIPDIFIQEGWFYTIVARGYASPPAGNQNELSAEILVN